MDYEEYFRAVTYDSLSEEINGLKIVISRLEDREFDLECEVKRLREQLLRGVEMMNKTPNQTKEGRRNWAKRFEREVREMIE